MCEYVAVWCDSLIQDCPNVLLSDWAFLFCKRLKPLLRHFIFHNRLLKLTFLCFLGWLGGNSRNHSKHHVIMPGFPCGPPLCSRGWHSCPDPFIPTVTDAQRTWDGRKESKIQATNRVIPSVSLLFQDSLWLACQRNISDAGKARWPLGWHFWVALYWIRIYGRRAPGDMLLER